MYANFPSTSYCMDQDYLCSDCSVVVVRQPCIIQVQVINFVPYDKATQPHYVNEHVTALAEPPSRPASDAMFGSQHWISWLLSTSGLRAPCIVFLWHLASLPDIESVWCPTMAQQH